MSRLKRSWAAEYKQWRHAPLGKDQWVYVWADGIHSGLRGSEDKLCSLVLIGVNERGEKHFLAMEDGVRESTQSWREVLIELQARGMNPPKLGIGDGAMGFWAAVDELWPKTKEQIWHAESKKDADKEFDTFVKMFEAKYPRAVACIVKD